MHYAPRSAVALVAGQEQHYAQWKTTRIAHDSYSLHVHFTWKNVQWCTQSQNQQRIKQICMSEQNKKKVIG